MNKDTQDYKEKSLLLPNRQMWENMPSYERKPVRIFGLNCYLTGFATGLLFAGILVKCFLFCG